MRLAKYIAHSGYCSRRSADKVIESGKVFVNSKIVRDFSMLVSEKDRVEINGVKLGLPKQNIWLYHKTIGVITSKNDPQGRPTIFEKLPSRLKSFISIGRLDINTEGLLLLTNNGDIAKFMTDPRNNIPRVYTVRAFGHLKEYQLEKVRKGICLDGMAYKQIAIKVIHATKNNSWFHLTLTEGKNREIRNIFNFLDLKIDRLIRTEYGIFKLGKLKRNEVEQASPEDLKNSYKSTAL